MFLLGTVRKEHRRAARDADDHAPDRIVMRIVTGVPARHVGRDIPHDETWQRVHAVLQTATLPVAALPRPGTDRSSEQGTP